MTGAPLPARLWVGERANVDAAIKNRRLCFDTNVLATNRRTPWLTPRTGALEHYGRVLSRCMANNIDIVITDLVLAEFVHVNLRHSCEVFHRIDRSPTKPEWRVYRRSPNYQADLTQLAAQVANILQPSTWVGSDTVAGDCRDFSPAWARLQRT